MIFFVQENRCIYILCMPPYCLSWRNMISCKSFSAKFHKRWHLYSDNYVCHSTILSQADILCVQKQIFSSNSGVGPLSTTHTYVRNGTVNFSILNNKNNLHVNKQSPMSQMLHSIKLHVYPPHTLLSLNQCWLSITHWLYVFIHLKWVYLICV